jgi:asparagine synthase (glutamine-hydrolysing)
VKTFTIGFKEAQYNEAPYAAAVARHLGTEHTEFYVTTAEAQQVIPSLPSIYDEPFGDSSQIPTFLVSQLARRSVTVALTGDGGDEVFAGYHRHLLMRKLRKLVEVPRGLRGVVANGIKNVPVTRWDDLFTRLDPVLPRIARHRIAGEKLHKLAGILDQPDERKMFAAIASHWNDRSQLVLGSGGELPSRLDEDSEWPDGSYLEQIVYLDTVTYLPDDILVKVDRATMGTSLESRIPFLDHELIERVWRMPMRMRMRGNTGKWLLRKILSQYVPDQLVERPKAGFGVPLDSWLRGGLREWAEYLLDPKRLREEGFFDESLVRRAWKTHLGGKINLQGRIWNVLVFQAWLESQKVSAPASPATMTV